MIDVLMHIGLGKCGSSALQTALSKNTVQKLESKKYNNARYIAIDSSGYVFEGEDLAREAESQPQKYLISTDLHVLDSWTDDTYEHIKKRIADISNNGKDLIVISNEGWYLQSEQFKHYKVFEKLGIKVSAVCYIRNIVELVNSSWWQWGAWESDLDNFLKMSTAHMKTFPEELIKWQNLIGEECLSVKEVPSDIVSGFAEYTGAKGLINNANRNNTSLPGEILRFYQMHKELRPSMHASQIDFILTNVFNFDNTYEKTPWVLNKDQIQTIIDDSRESNLKVISMLDPDSKQDVLSNPRWWKVSAFAEKKISTSACDKPCLPYEKLDDLLLQSINVIKELYLENLKLHREIKDITQS